MQQLVNFFHEAPAAAIILGVLLPLFTVAGVGAFANVIADRLKSPRQ